MSGSHMTYCLQIDKIVFFGMIMKTSLAVLMINTAVMRCAM